MKYPKLKTGGATATYALESPLTEAEVLQMAQQLAMSRLLKGRVLTERSLVFSLLPSLLQFHDYEILALLLLDTEHRVIGFRELFSEPLEGAGAYPREAVKIVLEHKAAAVILVHNQPSRIQEVGQADSAFSTHLKKALNMVGTQILDHVLVTHEGCISMARLGDQ